MDEKAVLLMLLVVLALGCTSRKEGTCEKDSQCSGAEVCFEGSCMKVKEVEAIKKKRVEDAKPKVCKDGDGDGARAGSGCPEGEPLDCDDANDKMSPGRTEVCDRVDNDCDGQINEDLKGCVRTLFGGATWGSQATHRLDNPHDLLVDRDGTLLLTDDNHLWRVHLDGRVELVAGSALSNFAEGQGAEARFSHPLGLALAPDGGYYLADCKNNCVRKVSRSGVTSTVAGLCSTLTKNTGQYMDGPASQARFYCPSDVAVAPDSTLVVVDRGNARIRRIAVDGTVTTIAGVGPVEIEEGEGQMGFKDGPTHEARFNDPQSVLVDPAGIIYVSESFNCRIRRIDLAKGEHGEVSTLAGESNTLLGEGGYADGVGPKAQFSYPHGMVFDAKGNLLVADTGNAVIRQVSPQGRVATIYGKPGQAEYVDGPVSQVRFKTPTDLACGPDGSLFVVDAGVNRLRWIVP
ncbi:MAG: hypothetical protein JXR96_02625 [Deltaproteobacteria bacterium]|nr:hypothetical protein [Deltaproteobacteria bacterium]